MQETIFCASSPSAPGLGQGIISIHDLQTGTTLASFKQTNTATDCTAVVESNSTHGGLFFAAQMDKAILNVYNFQKDQVALKVVLPEKLSVISTDKAGVYCAGGTVSGRIYFWEVASGILYGAWDAHYRKVTVLQFSADGRALISGSEDSAVNVWPVSRLVDNTIQNDIPEPFCTLEDHTLPITDLCCGVGPFPKCRLLTSAADHSVKLWDIASHTLLTTFQFPKPILRLVFDVTERYFFGASGDGAIYQINLFRQAQSESHSGMSEAIGGAGLSDMIRIANDVQDTQKRLISVGEPVTSLAISLSSSLLLVGTSTGSIHLYDIPSHQLLRTIITQRGFAITHLRAMQKPSDLAGHINLSIATGTTKSDDLLPILPVSAFQKMKDPKAREAHEVTVLLTPSEKRDKFSSTDQYEQLIRDHLDFLQKVSPDESAIPLQGRVRELEVEVAQLQTQLQKAKDVNDAMWDGVVRHLFSQGADSPEAGGPSQKKVRR
ncbi:WD40 repeat-like protein [Pluteus cervinus]|uniref:WD40 repeat-like protein n=1 Tax=Pluteus cervinus TaxID=181527 RepID=A0ACD3B9U7_9AGAR|nr:WD40 repeat-like protein [Pluteus cervinus]